jgi:hypothetical protein
MGDRFRISCVVNLVITLWRLRIARQFGGAWCRAGDRFRRRRTAAAHHPERLPLGLSVREWFALGQVVVGPLKGVAGESEVAEGGRLGRVQQLGAGRVVGFEQGPGRWVEGLLQRHADGGVALQTDRAVGREGHFQLHVSGDLARATPSCALVLAGAIGRRLKSASACGRRCG